MGYSLKEFLGSGAVELDDIPSKKHPDGKSYTFPSPDAETGLWIKHLLEFGTRVQLGLPARDGEAERLKLDDDEELDLYRKVMGDTLDELIADGVVWDHVQAVFGVLLAKHGRGQDIDVTLAEAAPSGGAATQPNRAKRRASARPAGSKSSPASSATRARTRAASTSASATSAKTKATA